MLRLCLVWTRQNADFNREQLRKYENKGLELGSQSWNKEAKSKRKLTHLIGLERMEKIEVTNAPDK